MYMYQQRKLSLNLFGTITLEGDIPEYDVIRKEKALPVEGLSFTFNPNVATDQEFIHFYASEKGKFIPLAASDIDLQLIQAKQIVNIGNPFDFPGIGKIIKKDDGRLTIIPGFYSIPPASGSARPIQLSEKAVRSEKHAGDRETEKNTDPGHKRKQWMILGAVAVLVVVVAWSLVKFVWPELQKTSGTQDIPVVQADTSRPVLSEVNERVVTDSINLLSDSLRVREWKAYISKNKTLPAAETKLRKYISYGHNAFLESADSNKHFIYLKVSAPTTDTAKLRDSLRIFFDFPVKIVPLQ